MIYYGEIVVKAKFSFHLNVSCIIFRKDTTTLEKFNSVLLVNVHPLKCVVSRTSIPSLKFI